MKKSDNNSKAKNTTKKMTKKKKIALSIILIAAVSFIAVVVIYLLGGYDSLIGTSSGKYDPIKSSKEDSKTVGKIDGYKVNYEELRYVAEVVKDRYRTRYGQDIFDDPKNAEQYRDMIEKEVMEELCGIYATLTVCDELNIEKDSKEINKYVDAQIAEIINKDFGGDITKYKEYLEKYDLTDAFNRFKIKCYYLDVMALQSMKQNGHDAIKYSDRNINEFIEYVMDSDDFYRTIHVYHAKSDDAEKDRSGMDTILKELQAKEDINDRYELMCDYIGGKDKYDSYDQGYSTLTADGFYITDGVFGDEYDKAARSVGEYDVALAETDYAYFLIMRMPKERSYVSKHVDDLLSYYGEKAYNDYKAKVASYLYFVPDEYYATLDILYLN